MDICCCSNHYEIQLDDEEWGRLSESTRKILLSSCGIDTKADESNNPGLMEMPYVEGEFGMGECNTKGHVLYRVKQSLKSSRAAKIRRERESLAQGRHSDKDLVKLFHWQQGCCYFCLTPLQINRCGLKISDGSAAHLDHLTSIAEQGSLFPSNLAWLCQACNCSKNKSDELTFWEITKQRKGKILVSMARKLKIQYLYKKRKLDQQYKK